MRWPTGETVRAGRERVDGGERRKDKEERKRKMEEKKEKKMRFHVLSLEFIACQVFCKIF